MRNEVDIDRERKMRVGGESRLAVEFGRRENKILFV